ncbi:uncharacterized protein LOC122267771, partial [Penaeus japonicus]|uniref:uncharacterized protein LOC122267771 n=1 Tax=Penaeus japonicus TaxID=27405 RepID=UPI001C715F8F
MKVQCRGRRGLSVAWCLLIVLRMGLLATGEETDEAEVERPFVTSIIRHHQGDIYTLPETEESCRCREGGGVMTVGPAEGCQCQCPSATATFRDDTSTCVSTLT